MLARLMLRISPGKYYVGRVGSGKWVTVSSVAVFAPPCFRVPVADILPHRVHRGPSATHMATVTHGRLVVIVVGIARCNGSERAVSVLETTRFAED